MLHVAVKVVAIKRIVDMHDGKVKLENRPEGGLSALVYLPIKVSTPAQ